MEKSACEEEIAVELRIMLRYEQRQPAHRQGVLQESSHGAVMEVLRSRRFLEKLDKGGVVEKPVQKGLDLRVVDLSEHLSQGEHHFGHVLLGDLDEERGVTYLLDGFEIRQGQLHLPPVGARCPLDLKDIPFGKKRGQSVRPLPHSCLDLSASVRKGEAQERVSLFGRARAFGFDQVLAP